MKSEYSFFSLLFFVAVVMILACGLQSIAQQPPNLIQQPYLLDPGLISRSISFENPTGEPGEGGKAASDLGPGRKGAAARTPKPGETVQLADIQGPGTIRHIWMTTPRQSECRRDGDSSLVGGPGTPEHRMPAGRLFRL